MSFNDSNGEHFPDLPPLKKMNFANDCHAWGEWFATYFTPSPWNSTEFLDGDVKTIIKLFNSSVPAEWQKPRNWTRATYSARVLEWYGFNYYYERVNFV